MNELQERNKIQKLLYREIKPFEETKHYAICPNCNEKAGGVDHLLNSNTSTMWYCDNCGARYSLKFENGKMFIGKTNECLTKTLVLLRSGHIALIVEGMNFSTHEENNDAYFYNEHTCPTNFMDKVKMIIDLRNNDNDPHGIFEYVATFPYDERIDDCDCSMETISEIFRTDLLTEKI